MKKFLAIITVLVLTLSAQAAVRGSKTSQSSNATASSQTLSPAAQTKADALYESLRKSYAQGKISADGVVGKALYHKALSPELAARCLSLVADKNARAQAELGHLYTYNRTAYMFPGKDAEGLSLMEQAARAGNRTASDYLGIYYNNKKDYAKALKYFNAAAPGNSPYALTILGEMYDKGNGVKKDRAKAREYYRRAAELGDRAAASKYGLILQREWYGKPDMPEAFKWLYIAGDLGDDFARSNLELPLRGERFGDDVQTDLTRRAFALTDAWNSKYGKNFSATPLYLEGFKPGLARYNDADEKGDQWSMFYLGSMSYNDEFLNRNYELVRSCYEPIIAAGTLPAPALALVYERMGEMYRNGHGVTANAAKAAQYTHKAADLGSLNAYKIIEKIPD
ncbi:MAG: sel1 repeat family protein [Muribaculaceae bacterium]|nr:sel1 repeat family protein [Muribaculaceae bacterium]